MRNRLLAFALAALAPSLASAQVVSGGGPSTTPLDATCHDEEATCQATMYCLYS